MSIPQLVVMNADGTVAFKDARKMLMGEHETWKSCLDKMSKDVSRVIKQKEVEETKE